MTAFQRRFYPGGAASTLLASNMSSSDTTFSILSDAGWPGSSPGADFFVVVDINTTSEEKMLCSGNSGTTVTEVARGQDGTTATSHNANATVNCCWTATDADESNQIAHLLGSAAAGTLFVGDGTDTVPSALPIGTAAQVLGVNSEGTAVAWQDNVGDVVGLSQYAPSPASVYGVNTSELAALDTTNLSVFLTTPKAGTINVQVQINFQIINVVSFASLMFGLFEHGTTTQAGYTQVAFYTQSSAFIGASFVANLNFLVEVEAAGSYQYDLAAGIDGGGTSNADVLVLGFTGFGNHGAGPAIFIASFV